MFGVVLFIVWIRLVGLIILNGGWMWFMKKFGWNRMNVIRISVIFL